MPSSSRKAALAGIYIAATAGRARNAQATHVDVGRRVAAVCTGHMTLLKQFLIDLAVASALLGGLILYAIWDQMPPPTTFERMSFSISP